MWYAETFVVIGDRESFTGVQGKEKSRHDAMEWASYHLNRAAQDLGGHIETFRKVKSGPHRNREVASVVVKADEVMRAYIYERANKRRK